jgi:hypothetical protein
VEGNIIPLQKSLMAALIATIAALLILTVTTTGLLSVNQTISSSGAVTAINVGVYSNSACTAELTSIAWGTISPGNSISRTIYLKNTGNAQITLSMTEANWNPASADGPITLAWNRESTTLDVGQVATATLTLSISEDISGITNFSMDIIISGAE